MNKLRRTIVVLCVLLLSMGTVITSYANNVEGNYIVIDKFGESFVNEKGEIVKNRWAIGSYYNENGKKIVNDITPDGYKVDSNGKIVELKEGEVHPEILQAREYFKSIQPDVTKEMYALVNNHRKNNGLKPLKISQTLKTGADKKMNEMVEKRWYSHTRYNGKKFTSHFDYIKNKGLAENIDYVSLLDMRSYDAKELANKLFNDWKSSTGHNKMMLNKNCKEIYFTFNVGESAINVEHSNDYVSYIYASQHFIL